MSWKSYFFPEEIGRYKSKINQEILVREIFGKKSIVVGDAEQTGGTIIGMWERAINKLPNQQIIQSTNQRKNKLQIKTCLVLGLGGGDVIRSLIKRYPDIRITCVEIDPVMKEIYDKYFQFPFKTSKTPVNIIIDDALRWVIQRHNQKFDLIAVDLYIGKLNPALASTISFLTAVKKLLANNGSVIYNRHYDENDTKAYQNFIKLCRKVFSKVYEIIKYKYCRILLLTTDNPNTDS